jgi:hypothetical protein
LRIFKADAAELFGPVIVSVDLDCIFVADMTDTLDELGAVDFCGYVTQDVRKDGRPVHYNGSFTYLRAGTRTQVWDDFDPDVSPHLAVRAGYMGSDQAWISYRLGTDERRLGPKDGFLSYRLHGALPLPGNAKFVSFYGTRDPWHPQAAKLEWVQKHYSQST